MNESLGHLQAKLGRRTSWGEMYQTASLSRHRIRNSSLGALRPSTLLYGWAERKHLLLSNPNAIAGDEPMSSDFTGKQL